MQSQENVVENSAKILSKINVNSIFEHIYEESKPSSTADTCLLRLKQVDELYAEYESLTYESKTYFRIPTKNTKLKIYISNLLDNYYAEPQFIQVVDSEIIKLEPKLNHVKTTVKTTGYPQINNTDIHRIIQNMYCCNLFNSSGLELLLDHQDNNHMHNNLMNFVEVTKLQNSWNRYKKSEYIYKTISAEDFDKYSDKLNRVINIQGISFKYMNLYLNTEDNNLYINCYGRKLLQKSRSKITAYSDDYIPYNIYITPCLSCKPIKLKSEPSPELNSELNSELKISRELFNKYFMQGVRKLHARTSKGIFYKIYSDMYAKTGCKILSKSVFNKLFIPKALACSAICIKASKYNVLDYDKLYQLINLF